MQRLLSGSRFYKANGTGSLAIAASALPWGDEFEDEGSLSPQWVRVGSLLPTAVVSGGVATFSGDQHTNWVIPADWGDGWEVTSKVYIDVPFPGLCVRNSVNGRSIAFLSYFSSTSYIRRFQNLINNGDVTTYPSDPRGHFQRFKQVGVNILIQTSTDNTNWTTRFTEPIAWLGGITHVGFSVTDDTPANLVVDWLRKTSI